MTFNIDNVICINLKAANEQQIFSLSETYFFDFEVVLTFKKTGINKFWYDKTVEEICIAYEFVDDSFKINEQYCPITKREKDQLLKVSPVAIPKIPTTDAAIAHYIMYMDKGYKIKSPKLDNIIKNIVIAFHDDDEEKLQQPECKPEETYNVDDLLDKIGVLGIESLSKAELVFLKEKTKK